MLCHVVIAAFALAGCESRQIETVTSSDDELRVGERELQDALHRHSAEPSSPESYAAFAKRLRTSSTLQKRHPRLRSEMEVRLTFLAIAPLASSRTMPLDEQVRALALTVWPTILQIPTRVGETSEQYVSRVCRDHDEMLFQDLPADGQRAAVTVRVFEELRGRADRALRSCDRCTEDVEYRQALSRLDFMLVETRAGRFQNQTP